MIDKELLRKKLDLFHKNESNVHIVIKDSKKFYNGTIKEVKEDLFILNDKKAGNIPILYEEVFKIEPYEKK